MLLADGQAFDRTDQNSMQIVANTKPICEGDRHD